MKNPAISFKHQSEYKTSDVMILFVVDREGGHGRRRAVTRPAVLPTVKRKTVTNQTLTAISLRLRSFFFQIRKRTKNLDNRIPGVLCGKRVTEASADGKVRRPSYGSEHAETNETLCEDLPA